MDPEAPRAAADPAAPSRPSRQKTPANPIKIPATASHLLLVLTAVLGVHLLERLFLWQDVLEAMADTTREALSQPLSVVQVASNCGLMEMYPDRSKSTETIIDAIKHAKARVLLLGVTFSEHLRFDDLLNLRKRSMKYV